MPSPARRRAPRSRAAMRSTPKAQALSCHSPLQDELRNLVGERVALSGQTLFKLCDLLCKLRLGLADLAFRLLPRRFDGCGPLILQLLPKGAHFVIDFGTRCTHGGLVFRGLGG